jgi:hypothetical protein
MKKTMVIIGIILLFICVLTFYILALYPSLGVLKAFCYGVISFIIMMAFCYYADKHNPLA